MPLDEWHVQIPREQIEIEVIRSADRRGLPVDVADLLRQATDPAFVRRTGMKALTTGVLSVMNAR